MTDLSELKRLQQARDRVWSSIYEYENRARTHRLDSENFLVALTNKTSEFINLGVAVIKRYENSEWQGKLGDTLHKYLKEINSTLDRPFICLEEDESYYNDHWVLKVPKSPRLKNVVAGLLMVSETTTDSDYRGDTHPVVHVPHDRSWEIHFNGKKGMEFKDEWLRNCREDPIFRICLKLPPKVI